MQRSNETLNQYGSRLMREAVEHSGNTQAQIDHNRFSATYPAPPPPAEVVHIFEGWVDTYTLPRNGRQKWVHTREWKKLLVRELPSTSTRSNRRGVRRAA